MSIEAMAYVKRMDLGACEKNRFLVLIIAENTFNDTCICAVGIEQLAFETRKHERTVRRQLDELIAAGLVLRKQRYPSSGGRITDALRIRGFKRWYLGNYDAAKRAHKARETSADHGQKGRSVPGKMSGRATGQQMSGVTGHQVSGTYKETRTTPVLKDARGAREEDLNLILEGKGVRDRLRTILGGAKFAAWCADMAFVLSGDVVTASTPAPLKARWCQQHFADPILAACQAEWPGVRTVSIQTSSGGAQ